MNIASDPAARSRGTANPGVEQAVPGQRRVLHVLASSGMYGVERMLLALLPGLRRLGCDAQLLCLSAPGTEGARVAGALDGIGVPVRYAPFGGRLSPGGLARLDAAIRKSRPDVLHVHGYKATILAAPLALLHRIPAVATVHTEIAKTVGFDTYVRIEKPILRALRAIIAVSEPIRDELIAKKVRAERIRVIPNGIADPFPGSTPTRPEPERPVLCFTGRLVEGKNVHLLIEATARLRSEFPGLRLVLAGEGPLRAVLEAQAAALGLGEAVHFAGFVDDVFSLLRSSTCFVLPSQREGMPIALLEAMVVGVPIVATTVGSIPSIVADGVEAVLVAPDDGPALIESLRRVLGDPAFRSGIATRARERVLRDFSVGRTAARYTDVYDRLVTARRARV